MKKVILVLTCLSTFAFAATMAIYNYQCKQCSAVIQKDNKPNESGCPRSSSGHDWRNLGEVGDDNYQCKDCATLIMSKNRPNDSGCPKSSSGHDWRRL